MASAEKLSLKVLRKSDLVRRVNGMHFLTELGQLWQQLSLMEQIITNNDDPDTPFSASPQYMEGIRRRREELLAELPGGNDPKSRGRAFSILGKYELSPRPINHLPPSGVIFSQNSR